MSSQPTHAGDDPDRLSISLMNTQEDYRRTIRLVNERMGAWHVGERARYVVELACEEMLVNVIRYAYPAGEVRPIQLTFIRQGTDLSLVLEDAGMPFDPTRHDPSPAGGRIEDVTIGGRGILMVRKLAHAMRYERRGDRNRLELIIRDLPE